MSKLNKKRKRNLFWSILLLVAGGGTYAYLNYFVQPTQAAATEEAPVQTAEARRGDLVIYASGAGTVIASVERGVGFAENGTLTELLVAVGDVVQAEVDVMRLRQVVQNLLENALRHTPAGGQVCVGLEADDQAMRIQVSDTGEGIPPSSSRTFSTVSTVEIAAAAGSNQMVPGWGWRSPRPSYSTRRQGDRGVKGRGGYTLHHCAAAGLGRGYFSVQNVYHLPFAGCPLDI